MQGKCAYSKALVGRYVIRVFWTNTLFRRRIPAALQFRDDSFDDVIGCRCAGGHPDNLGIHQPIILNILRPLDVEGRNPERLPDLGQSRGIGAFAAADGENHVDLVLLD
jgi:hypothetical protein